MRRRMLRWALDRAEREENTAFAAVTLPRLERSIPATDKGAQLVRSLVDDERWTGRYVGALALPRFVPERVPAADAWALLLRLAADCSAIVRQGAAIGVGRLVIRAPSELDRLERLLVNPEAPLAERRAALRSLVVVAETEETVATAERLLRRTVLCQDRLAASVGTIVTRGLGARDPGRALMMLRDWAQSDNEALRECGRRALDRWEARAEVPAYDD
jgi:hypothetical protein